MLDLLKLFQIDDNIVIQFQHHLAFFFGQHTTWLDIMCATSIPSRFMKNPRNKILENGSVVFLYFHPLYFLLN